MKKTYRITQTLSVLTLALCAVTVVAQNNKGNNGNQGTPQPAPAPNPGQPGAAPSGALGNHDDALSDPVGFFANAEAALLNNAALVKAKLVYKTHDYPLLIKLYFRDAQGRSYAAMFKPNNKKRYGTNGSQSYTYKPGAVEYAYYKIAKKLAPYSEFRSAPVVPFSISKERLLQIAVDDSDTRVNELTELRNALNGNAAKTSSPIYESGNILTGSAMLWMNDTSVHPNNRAAWRREASRLSSRNDADLSLIQLFILDYIVANNDRAGNAFMSRVNGQAWSIDNDDSFVAASRKTFCRDLYNAVQNPGNTFLNGLEALRDMSASEWNDVFRFYSDSKKRTYTEQTKTRINQALRKF